MTKLKNVEAMQELIKIFDRLGLTYFSIKGDRDRGFHFEWWDTDIDNLNWIDDQSSPPFKYRVSRDTVMARMIVKSFEILPEECRLLSLPKDGPLATDDFLP